MAMFTGDRGDLTRMLGSAPPCFLLFVPIKEDARCGDALAQERPVPSHAGLRAGGSADARSGSSRRDRVREKLSEAISFTCVNVFVRCRGAGVGCETPGASGR